MNDRTMSGPRRVETRWPQTVLLLTRSERIARNATRPRKAKPRIDWGLCLMVAGAVFLAASTLLYSMTGPS